MKSARSFESRRISHERKFQPSEINALSHDPRVLWQGPTWRLVARRVTLPAGTTIEQPAIDHPGAVVLIPLRETNGAPVVLMLRQFRFAVGETLLELPAGTRGWGEDWLQCAQRELREETGYRAESFTPLGELWPAPGLSNELMKLYLASGLIPDPLPADDDEVIQLQPMPLDELVTLATDGRIRDAKSIIGLLRAARYLNR